jgi:hypothetical protein
MDAASYNRELDHRLASEGIVDAQTFGDLLNAFGDSASSHGWVQAKLQVLRGRVLRGIAVTVHDRTSKVEIASSQAFETWVQRHFPGLERGA